MRLNTQSYKQLTNKKMNTQSYLILLVFISVISTFVIDGVYGSLGAYQPIEDLTSPDVQKVGQFAVSEHNKQAKTQLAYDKVIKGEQQVVQGYNYRLDIQTRNADQINTYVAQVYEKLDGQMILNSFQPL
ncbi:hypothetical protein AQUCO_00300453v1 [Aquilegia coerulea]|uniref:Cystatin domain-containing protein n=1 Tax=Aquilegia coerulea TaxID=218851 RepID=A0A2G5EYZ1_AQUCA|nr:hypothetical protein AQUCO_00300453v1 [Aquilegia coerulea]